MLALNELMSPLVDMTVLVPGSRLNREAACRPGAPQAVIPLGLEPASSLLGKAANRVSLRADGRLRRRDPGMPYLPLLVGLARSGEARKALREADVIDLQWSDSIRLAHLLRRINPRARLVGTFHDVMSQSFAREPQETQSERRYWQAVARRSRRHERRMVRALDEVLVFSEKDIKLLGSPAHARVVRPPLASGTFVRHGEAEAGRGVVLVVSYLARDENDKAASWVISEVWPRVAAQFPDARLRLVGGGASDELRNVAGENDTVEMAGFVDDLDAEYGAAAACLIPVAQGAGVKFKTIEALLHGVPTVTTTVGAEGVGPDDLFFAVTDDARSMSDALCRVLAAPEQAQPVADKAQEWASGEFSRARFVTTVSRVWGLST